MQYVNTRIYILANTRKTQEHDNELHIIFMDFKEAFNIVQKYGVL